MSKTIIIIAIAISFVAIFATVFLIPMVDTTSQNTEQDEMPIIPNSNFAVAGDFGITEDSLATMRNMANYDPDVVLLLGDLSYSSPDAWFSLSDLFLNDTTVLLTIGNHEHSKGYTSKDWLSYYDLSEFYSYTYHNVHFISLSTQTSYLVESDQFKFLESNLKSASNNPDIDWIIVFFHKPMYTDSQWAQIDFRNTIQPIFDKYGVDLVLQAHAHVYERTSPLKFNNTINDDGQTFVTVSTGGHSHLPLWQKSEWSIIQNNEDFGFLNLNLIHNGKILRGEFIANDGKILDVFELCSNTCPVRSDELEENDLNS